MSRDLETSAVDLALALHPTPAVAGTPRDAALAAIHRLEPTPRDLYAGPCGWVDARGDGEFVVALRGAQIDGRARLHAGAGIVAGSNATAEWAETRAKLEPMLRALIRVELARSALRGYRSHAETERSEHMIGTFVTFQYDGDLDAAKVEKIASDVRGMFEGMPGLRSKAFTFDKERKRARTSTCGNPRNRLVPSSPMRCGSG